MEVVYTGGCGVDMHKATVCGCISIKSEGGRTEKEKRRFETNTGGLNEPVARLRTAQVSAAALEATGVHWKPV